MPTNSLIPAIAFIGGGNMARSLIGGAITAGLDAATLHVAEPVTALRQALTKDFNVRTYEIAEQAAAQADVWVLAVKPQVMRTVCAALSALTQQQRPLVISIAAGITIDQLQRWLSQPNTGQSLPVVRAMPNTPALLGAGATGLHASAQVDERGRAIADTLLRSAGCTVWIDDEMQMDAVTALSGSGPAYVFLLAEAMQAAGIAEGLPADAARVLALQTVLGAARMLTESDADAAELRRRVTSPGGTTQAAIETLQAGGFEALVQRAIRAARVRGSELSQAND